jgi:4-hydroxy-3-methylbut-2-enyl diphosphate reductase
MKSFQIPDFYRSPLISAIKSARKNADKMKKDFTPTRLDFGPLEIFLARHFGFCYGVENAIEIAFRTVDENPGKRIFLLSEMIHNPQVNADLQKNGVSFIMDTKGRILTPWENLNADDIVIIPAFGTTLETEQKLRQIGIDPLKYNTTCPFVEKVWNRSEQIGTKGHTIIIHGKPDHEETRATFSHSSVHAPALVIRDMQEAQLLAEYITRKKSSASFFIDFEGQYSADFNPELHLQFIGVVNQTTMLASETQGIADYLKGVIIQQFGETENHFADTRDTLCYATNDNQSAVQGMLSTDADLAIVIGGYNSSNTSHLVELCEKKLPTYYIENQDNISADGSIRHYDFHQNQEKNTKDFLPQSAKTRILISSGASCPDAIVEKVIQKLQGFYAHSRPMSELIAQFE